MQKLFYFSDYFKPIAGKLRFAFTVAGRFIKLFFRRRKSIVLLQLEYSRKHLFDNSFLVVGYRFRNALWYDFRNLRTTTEKDRVVFNLKKIDDTGIVLIVYGFFRKKIFHIPVKTEYILINQTFRTTISKMSLNNGFTPVLRPEMPKPVLVIPGIAIKDVSLEVSHLPFTQTDFI